MSLNVSTWSIHNPIAVILFFILLTVAGIGGFLAMQIQNFPDIDFPIITERLGAAVEGVAKGLLLPVQVETHLGILGPLAREQKDDRTGGVAGASRSTYGGIERSQRRNGFTGIAANHGPSMFERLATQMKCVGRVGQVEIGALSQAPGKVRCGYVQ